MTQSFKSDLFLNLGLFILLIALCIFSLFHGRPFLENYQSPLTIMEYDPISAHLIISDIRLPRTLLACLVGATLGLSGAVLQGLLRNPLAEPGLVGATGGAAVGAVIVFYFSLYSFGQYSLPIGGIIGAAIALFFLYLLTGKRPSIMTLILAGVAINALAAAVTALALNLAPNPYAAMEIAFWLMGSFADRTMDHILFILPFVLIGWILLFTTARSLSALTLGESTASSLGHNINRVKMIAFLGTGSAVGACVAVSGAIGFVGLIVPHILRPLVNYESSRLLLPSLLGGACLTLIADLAIRILSSGLELKIGVLTSLIGAPFFLYLILKSRKEIL
jgi:iron complex transport system permease protein